MKNSFEKEPFLNKIHLDRQEFVPYTLSLLGDDGLEQEVYGYVEGFRNGELKRQEIFNIDPESKLRFLFFARDPYTDELTTVTIKTEDKSIQAMYCSGGIGVYITSWNLLETVVPLEN